MITFGGMTAPSGFSFLVARLTSDGALDPTFGTGGIRVDSPQGGETTEAIAMRPNGRIVAVGSSFLGSDTAVTFEVGVGGGLLPSWGICGYRNVQVAGATTGGTYGVIIDPDGRTVAVGFSSVGLGSGRLFVVRLLPDSTIDPTFGTAGVVDLELGGPDAFAIATGVARGTDGRLYLSGRTTSAQSTRGFVLALTDGGVPDGSFAPGGLVYLDAQQLTPEDIDVTADDRVLVVGSSTIGATTDLAVARLARNVSVAPAYTC